MTESDYVSEPDEDEREMKTVEYEGVAILPLKAERDIPASMDPVKHEDGVEALAEEAEQFGIREKALIECDHTEVIEENDD